MPSPHRRIVALLTCCCLALVSAHAHVVTAAVQVPVRLRVCVIDEADGQALACRVYLESASGERFHVESAEAGGTAVSYRVQRSPESIEVHTAVSAHPFQATLYPGRYLLTIERGKEYAPESQAIELTDADQNIEIRLRRWINMAELGWYSGETHVHRPLDQLPTAMLADDLNVAFPLVYWVTSAYTPPAQGDKNLPPPA
jgi:hypothetical protein